MSVAERTAAIEHYIGQPPTPYTAPGDGPSRAQIIEATTRVLDTENECEHGHLPFDRNPACECWTLQRTHALVHQEPLVLSDFEIDPDRRGPVITMQTTDQTAERRARAEEIHAVYIAEELSAAEVGRKFDGITGGRVLQLFHEFGLEVRPRGWRANRERQRTAVGSAAHTTPVAPPAPAPEPDEEIVDAIVPQTPVQSKAFELLELLEAELVVHEREALRVRDQIAAVKEVIA